MNRFAALWNKHEERLKPDGPDGLTLGDQRVVFEEETMPVQKNLPQGHLDSVIRMIFREGRDRVVSLQHATHNTLKRLKVRRNLTRAVVAMPAGSDQVDLMSLFVWMNKVTREDKAAIAQVVAIDATASSRLG